MNKILILSHAASDLSDLLLRTCPGAVFVPFADCADVCMDDYDALAILGGNGEASFTIPPHLRVKAEDMADGGKPVFCEFVSSFRCFYSGDPERMTHHRLVYHETGIGGLETGDVLDGHCNDCISYYLAPACEPIHTYHDYV